MDHTDSSLGLVSLGVYLGVGIPTIILATCFVAIRLWTTWEQEKKFRIEEYICIIVIALFIPAFALRIYVVRAYEVPEGLNGSPSFILTMEMGQTIIAAFLSSFAKVPLFMLYVRLFGTIKWVRMVCYYSIAITLLQFIIGSSLVGAFCNPTVKNTLDAFLTDRCWAWRSYVVLCNGAITLVTDMILFVIPFPVITKLQLSRPKKIKLAIVFTAGFFGIVIGGISLDWRVITLRNGVIPAYTLMLSTVVECSVAIMISCVPAIPPFWTKHVSKTTFYLRIQSAMSALLPHERKTHIGSGGNLRDHMSNEVNNDHHFVRLNDEASSKESRDMRPGASSSWLAV
ncbi:hypothetical protein F4774DRAFT_413729 [Daldinia eschscholtzii]|nr:hypothetical protein F4774DRAFT_413729 [Daldinia eschscholtzii]